MERLGVGVAVLLSLIARGAVVGEPIVILKLSSVLDLGIQLAGLLLEIADLLVAECLLDLIADPGVGG